MQIWLLDKPAIKEIWLKYDPSKVIMYAEISCDKERCWAAFSFGQVRVSYALDGT